ncbi:abortive infection system antitoxin AbiGi family protein [Chryseobacterium sp. Ch-15]|uniref:Abortive infection system antitoxin AbiGi family protein n=1 Tax=Chryseobacterium muglaense TaxID=2893752 RepID=A0A9Q3YQI5_9FLAO|nr:abortive infection system antitoxin AbiGi family protein [Chryseobacterium muglaense]MBD3906884.1 hypothetical protein [Chryseobacterium muglaense]MCC9033038.1 abortive infection system antitoxin AbiGi family protein [Chryseobacterium muglaense]MCM2556624.1 abortive infection system antitoxin AbiGi family protein [Chryseobacterium muglaense]
MPDYVIDLHKTFSPSKMFVPFVHFTDNFEKLCKIIEEGFMVNYCTETLSNNDRDIRSAFPMISLSNLTIDQGKYALASYGTFGIALTKRFVEKYKFNPVLYLDRHSDITKYVVNSFDTIKENYWEGRLESHLFNEDSKSELVLFSRNLMTQFAYSKNYDAELVRKGFLIDKNYRFGLEREWRLVHKEKNIKYFLIKEEVDNKRKFNEIIRDVRYTIEFEDLEEILVEADYQVDIVKKILQNKFGKADVKISINTRRHMDDEG